MSSHANTTTQNKEDPAVTNFREYLRIKTVPPDHDYDGAVAFLTHMAEELELPFQVIEVQPGKPVFLITWKGTRPELPSILLNSHIDVVPVFPEHWKYDPFSAHKDEHGNIYARGSQDMKCVGNQYIEAIRRLKGEGKTCMRTVHVSFVPDEETNPGDMGMALFVKTQIFKDLNVGFAMDEGWANPTDVFTVFYGERCSWNVHVTCKGDPGHGSRFIENTAAEKFRKVVNKFFKFRDSEEARLKNNPKLKLGDVTTCNLTIINGGVQLNVVPSEMHAYFNIRIAPTVNLVTFREEIEQWCSEAGPDVTVEFPQEKSIQKLTSISPNNPWWKAFSTVCSSLKINIETEVFPAATDSRFLRALDIPAIGFSPMNHTPVLLHDHNEFLNEDIYLKGIEYYTHIIPAVASVPEIFSGVHITCKGNPGHGSRFIENTAAEKMNKVVNSFLKFREDEKARLKNNPKLTLGDVTTCNMNIINGGVQLNVVPSEMHVYFDIRVTPSVDFVKFEEDIEQWCKEAGQDVIVEIDKDIEPKLTSVSQSDPWWKAFSTACLSMGIKIETEIFPAGTDSRFLRAIDIPAIGFSPMNLTPVLLHDHNEYLNEDIYLKGIEYYRYIISAIANVPYFVNCSKNL